MRPTPLPGLSRLPPLREMLIVYLRTALLILSGFLIQGRISIGTGIGWDGVDYANMAANPQQIPDAPASSPFRLRVLLPLLVHYAGPLPNVADNFWFFNLIFATLYSVGVYVLLGVAFPTSHAVSQLLIAEEQGPIQTTLFIRH